MLTVLLGLFIHGCITLPLIYIIMTRSNPLKVIKAALQALLTAFGTSSRYLSHVHVPFLSLTMTFVKKPLS